LSAVEKNPLRIITIASGKGGVGKTNIALNLALALLEEKHKVCLLDADLGLANIDVLLGISPPFSLMDFLEEKCDFEQVRVQGPDNLTILPGGSALERLPELKDAEKIRLQNIFDSLQEYDDLVIDAPAGISESVLRFLEWAHWPVLVVIPEPTSLTDAYSLIKTYYKRHNSNPLIILTNQAKSENQASLVFKKLEDVTKVHLNLSLQSAGYIPLDPQVKESVGKQTPFLKLFPDSPSSQAVRQVAKKLLNAFPLPAEQTVLKDFFMLKEPAAHAPQSAQPQNAAALEPAALPGQEDMVPQSELDFPEDIVRILIQEGHVTDTQVAYAKKVLSKLDTPRRFLEILKDLGYINESKIRDALVKNRTGIRLGSLLVALGFITGKQLAVALNMQKESKTKKRLGEILIENNYIKEYDLIQALSMNLGFPYADLKPEMVSRPLLRKAPLPFFQAHGFVPLSEENGIVKIAMADPLNATALNAAKKLYGQRLVLMIALAKSIKNCLQVSESSDQVIESPDKIKSEIVELVDRLIADALNKRVSDIHIEPCKNRVRVRFRKDGSLIHHMDFSKDIEQAVISRLKVMASANITERRRHQDGRILITDARTNEEIDIRASFYITIFGEKVVLRLLSKKAELYKIEDLGMGPKIMERFKEDALDLPSGVIIITGPTGAGKTTTLYASINYCNTVDTCIITAEEPVEYIIEGIAQCPIDPKIGRSYEETLRHILRQDPDIIILGEIRDKFSAESAIQAALTGHKVLTTFHTEDSIGGLLRLMNMDIESFLISSTVVCVVAQRLIKKICPYCTTAYTPTAKDLRRLKYQPQHIRGFNFKIGSGCSRCDFTGYYGRVGIFEMLILNEYVKDAILKRKTSYEIRRISLETTGLITLLEDGLVKAAKGQISIPEIIRNLPLLEPPRPLDQIQRLVGDAA
jgi:type IV pilus assembly protein PilB